MQDKRATNVLKEEIDEEILEKMPEWFKILKNASHLKIK
jgi:hypothetical protein